MSFIFYFILENWWSQNFNLGNFNLLLPEWKIVKMY